MRETIPRLVRLGAPLHLALTGQSVPLSSLASPARGVERADDRRPISGIVQVLRGFAMLYGHEAIRDFCIDGLGLRTSTVYGS